MDVSRLMVHAHKKKLKEKTKDSKRVRRDDGDSSHSRSGGGNCSRGKDSSDYMWPECRESRRRHEGKCLIGTDDCFGCGKSGHKIRDYPSLTAKGRDGRQVQSSGFGSSAPKQYMFYALQIRKDHEASPNLAIGKLWSLSLWLRIP
ncbi:uncharacterized protein LOC125873787 [Solanum stenotomum]|uniref:uncharacterized protein LOC125873787 n=1 Tax=Solanum stenotomum TaxID=172797 RepID=UPI0020D1D297|nr:uncharacterized protein LOC125873787 [Solanum stenotomum]